MAHQNSAWFIGNMGHFCFFMVFGLALSALMPGAWRALFLYDYLRFIPGLTPIASGKPRYP